MINIKITREFRETVSVPDKDGPIQFAEKADASVMVTVYRPHELDLPQLAEHLRIAHNVHAGRFLTQDLGQTVTFTNWPPNKSNRAIAEILIREMESFGEDSAKIRWEFSRCLDLKGFLT